MVATATQRLDDDDLGGWLTFDQAEVISGVSRPTLRKWIDDGKIRTSVAKRYGTHHTRTVLHPGDVAKIARHSVKLPPLVHDTGEFAARVFELLDKGRSNREIVILMRSEPARVEDLRQAWLDAGGADVVLNADALAELARCLGPFRTIPELLERARAMCPAVEATLPDDVGDAEIESRIVEALDQATAP